MSASKPNVKGSITSPIGTHSVDKINSDSRLNNKMSGPCKPRALGEDSRPFPVPNSSDRVKEGV